LALAAMNYESSNGVFPSHSMQGPTYGAADPRVFSWGAPLLQYAEQGTLFNALNFNLEPVGTGIGGAANSTVSTTKVNMLLCPSDSSAQPLLAWSGSIYYGTTNYVGNLGGPGVLQAATGTIIPTKSWMTAAYTSGSFGPVTIGSITDGTSNTALFSERLVGINSAVTPSSNQARRAVFLAPSGVGVTGNVNDATTFYQACRNIPGTTAAQSTTAPGQMWLGTFSIWQVVNGYNHFGTPNQLNCSNPSDPGLATDGSVSAYVGLAGSAPPSSNHSGGVNVSFADGSVRFVKDAVSTQAWWALGTRNGGEVVSSDSY